MDLKIVVEESEKEVLIKLSGSIYETALLDFKFPNDKKILIDLEMIGRINSSGISKWCLWMRNYKGQGIHFINVSRAMVQQLNTTREFVPPGSIIESFYVPYYDPESGDTVEFKFQRGIHYQDKKLILVPELKNKKGQDLDLDVLPERFFRFLELYA